MNKRNTKPPKKPTDLQEKNKNNQRTEQAKYN
jgi:hypothetical protein